MQVSPVRPNFRLDQVHCRRVREHIKEGGDHLLAGYVGDGDGDGNLHVVWHQEDRLVVHGGNQGGRLVAQDGDLGIWVKSRCLNREEFVVVGWTDPEGSRSHIGALLLGYYTEDGRLHYADRASAGRHRT